MSSLTTRLRDPLDPSVVKVKEKAPAAPIETKTVEAVKIDEKKKFVIFVSDTALTPHIKDNLHVLAKPILQHTKANSGMFKNRDIKYLQEKGYLSLWLVNNNRLSNEWLSAALAKNRADMTVICVYTKRKHQNYIKEVKPDLIVRKNMLAAMAVLTAEEFFEQLEGYDVGHHISQAASWCERAFNKGKRVKKKVLA